MKRYHKLFLTLLTLISVFLLAVSCAPSPPEVKPLQRCLATPTRYYEEESDEPISRQLFEIATLARLGARNDKKESGNYS